MEACHSYPDFPELPRLFTVLCSLSVASLLNAKLLEDLVSEFSEGKHGYIRPVLMH